MKHFYLYLFAFCSCLSISAQSDDFISKVEQAIKDKMEKDSSIVYDDYLKTTKDIVELKAAKKFSGRAILGFNGETTRDDNNSLFNIYGGINLDWDLYPGELDFYTAFGVTFSDGKLQENVSRIDISYDYLQTKVGNGLLLENYVYINRSTDAYLGIDQRYEIGGGFIINNWIKKYIPPANERLPKVLHSEQDENDWQNVLSNSISNDEFEDLKSDFEEDYNKNRKSNSKLRTALLVGLFFELQQTTVNGTIELDPTYHFRWSLRPTMDIKLRDGWKMSLRPYFKMPMPWEWQSIVEDEFGSRSARADFLVDFSARLTTQLASKRVEVGFIYNLVYDNAPPRIYVTNDTGSELQANNNLHQSFRMNMSVSLAK